MGIFNHSNQLFILRDVRVFTKKGYIKIFAGNIHVWYRICTMSKFAKVKDNKYRKQKHFKLGMGR